jgi:regulator of protease activity HflC (stomatin/prohibitin superfamily)
MVYTWVALALLVLAVPAAIFANRKSQIIYAGSVGLLYRKGVFERQLAPGQHRWFDPGRVTKLVIVQTTRTPVYSSEVSVISKDQFSFRIGLMPVVVITDPRAYHEAQAPATSAHLAQFGHNFPELTPTLQAALLVNFARRTLDEIIASPAEGIDDIRAVLQRATPGAEVVELMVTSLTMPPEVRKMFTEVERAKREALAALERARGEQASLRALANAARAMQGNPQLAHLRLLQTMDGAKGAKTFILGNTTGLQTGSGDTK